MLHDNSACWRGEVGGDLEKGLWGFELESGYFDGRGEARKRKGSVDSLCSFPII